MTAARDGNPEALEDLARAYDRALKPILVQQRVPGEDLMQSIRRENEALERITQALRDAPGDALPVERSLPYGIAQSPSSLESFTLNRPLSEGELIAAQRGDPFYKFQGPFSLPDFLRPDKIADSLADIPPERLKNMSYAEAVIEANSPARFRADWGAAVERVRKGKDVPKDVKMFGVAPEPTAEGSAGAWHQLRDPRAAEMEGALLGHSVGGYSRVGPYGHGGLEAFQSGKAGVYSLRDAKANPRITVETLNTPEGVEVTQIKARTNGGPRQAEVNDVFKLFDELDKGGRLRNIRPENYPQVEGAPPDALVGLTEWKRLYDEYLLGKQ